MLFSVLLFFSEPTPIRLSSTSSETTSQGYSGSLCRQIQPSVLIYHDLSAAQHNWSLRPLASKTLSLPGFAPTSPLGLVCWILLLSSTSFLFFKFIDFREEGGSGGKGREERERKKKTSICCSTYLCICWLIPVCALTGDQSHNLGVSGQCTNQLSHPARAVLNLVTLVISSSLTPLRSIYVDN